LWYTLDIGKENGRNHMSVVQMQFYSKGKLSESDTDESRVISTHISNMKKRGWKVREVSRGRDNFPFLELLMVKDDADMEVPFVEVQGEYANLVFLMLPDYDEGWDDTEF
jgi:hypothetical protein